ncbi:Zn(2)-C6 fungal-type domain-containing protein [Mycena sanguinolenta]|uniref:Zn(2)-C6 fungal-type domain-containing protein n=1 Tax=Mycena sanguinolenta TaxID=230812 RepID=A0A8H6XFM9_9AGAR|nr:Zn(2)-C6 fungal-type domain-containing protein [Mycena sanguinolenta]
MIPIAREPLISCFLQVASQNNESSHNLHVLKHQIDTVVPAGSLNLISLHIESMNLPAPDPAHAPDAVEAAERVATQNSGAPLPVNQIQNRFQSKSSDAVFAKTSVQLCEEYERKDMACSSRRMRYWTFNAAHHRTPHVGRYVFPPQDLLFSLINLYFVHQNLYFPVLHRPSFERSIADGLHTRDKTTFGAVVLLVCAIGSRFSEDARVNPPGAEPLRRGWEFFDQLLPLHLDHILFEKPTIYDLQYYCLAASFLEYSDPTACWNLIGIGLRLAQDVGAHRQRTGPPTVESELRKRAFWVLVCHDRQVSMALGQSSIAQFDEIDAELPIECDDEFWENENPSQTFIQPQGKASLITFFNCYLRLNNILAFVLKILYSPTKMQRLLAYQDDAWEEHIVAETDSALNGWIDGIPPHLRWDPNRQDDALFDQSVFLYASYYLVQMTIHRPFIHTIRKGKPTSLPSLAICSNAARSCSRIADVSRLRKNGVPVPVLISSVFTSGMILLLNVWNGKRTGLPPGLNSAITEVHKCLATLRVCEKLWQVAGLFCDLLCELASIGQLPVPEGAVQPTPETSVYAREEDKDNPAKHPGSVSPVNTAHHWNPLPTYTAELGKPPVFHRQPTPSFSPGTQSTTSLYPMQQGWPLAPPDLGAGSRNEGVNDSAAISNMDLPLDLDWDLRLTSDELSSDVIAMWANTPTSFQVGDWELYFNLINELYQDIEPAAEL